MDMCISEVVEYSDLKFLVKDNDTLMSPYSHEHWKEVLNFHAGLLVKKLAKPGSRTDI